LAEHCLCKAGVRGSIPLVSTMLDRSANVAPTPAPSGPWRVRDVLLELTGDAADELAPRAARTVRATRHRYQAPASNSADMSRHDTGSAHRVQVIRGSAACPQERCTSRTGGTSFSYRSPQAISDTRIG
jgi:hypothetical protein